MNKFKSLPWQFAGHCLAVVALVCLMFVPFMMNRRVGPQTGFVIEATTMILALLMVLGVSVMGKMHRKPPLVSIMFAGLAMWVMVQGRFLHLAWLSQVDLAAVILLVVALATWALHSWQQHEPNQVFQYIAWGLVIGVLLQTGVMWLQYFGMTKHFDGYLSYSNSTNIMGQLGQRNHLGHYLMWGMVAVLYLHHTQRLNTVLSMILVTWVGLSMGLIGSRTLITYLLAIGLLACVWRMRVGRVWQVQWYWVMAALVWVMAVQFGLEKVLFLFSQAQTQTGVERLVTGAQVVDTGRSTEWLKAWQSFLHSPMVGHGWGSGASQSMLLHSESMVNRSPLGVLFTHSHNSVLQLLLEVGLVGVVWIAGCLSVLVWRCLRCAQRPESFAILALVAVSVCHSLLEYPLWYVYFLVPFALFWSLVPSSSNHLAWSVPTVNNASYRRSVVVGLVSVVLLAGVVRSLWAYQDIMSVYGVAKNEKPAVSAQKSAKINMLLEREYLLNYYVRMALIERSFDAYQGTWSDVEADNARIVATYRPYPSYANRWGLYQYRAGKRDEALQWFEQVWRYYPNHMSHMISTMPTSPYYTDLWPIAQQRCWQYQQQIARIKCGTAHQ